MELRGKRSLTVLRGDPSKVTCIAVWYKIRGCSVYALLIWSRCCLGRVFSFDDVELEGFLLQVKVDKNSLTVHFGENERYGLHSEFLRLSVICIIWQPHFHGGTIHDHEIRKDFLRGRDLRGRWGSSGRICGDQPAI